MKPLRLALFLLAAAWVELSPAQTTIPWLGNTGTNAWNFSGNWVDGNIPNASDEIALFRNAPAHDPTIYSGYSYGIYGIEFENDSDAYTLTIDGSLAIGGSGIVNGGNNDQAILNRGVLVFTGNAAAKVSGGGTGDVTITNAATASGAYAEIAFEENSTIGEAILANTSTGGFDAVNRLVFSNTAGSGSALLTNTAGGGTGLAEIVFNAPAGSGAGTITNTASGSAVARVVYNAGAIADGTLIANSATGAGAASLVFNDASAGASTINNANATSGTVDITFNGAATAGSAHITGTASGQAARTVSFHDTASAGTSQIIQIGNGAMVFDGSSSAGEALLQQFYNDTGIAFRDHASAGTADIISSGSMVFSGHATAGAAMIYASDGMGERTPSLAFTENATAAQAGILLYGNAALRFSGSASAGNASIDVINLGGSTITFSGHADGGASQVWLRAASTLDFRDSDLPAVGVGSLMGDGGTVYLGGRQFTVGGRNFSTTFDGVITDSGEGGSLVKVGTGTLTLTGANSYSGGTTIRGGALDARNLGFGPLTLDGGTLITGSGTLASVILGANGGGLSAFTPISEFLAVQSVTGSGPLTISGSVAFTGSNSYTGTTSIANGTLRTTTNGVSDDIVVNNSGDLVFDQAFTGTYSGNIIGLSFFTKQGAGAVVLTGSNGSARVMVDEGNLTIGSGASFVYGPYPTSGVPLTIGSAGKQAELTIAGGRFLAIVTNVGSGSDALGALTVSSGSMDAGAIALGNGGGVGTLRMDGGALSSANTWIGYYGSGTATLAGGIWHNSDTVTISGTSSNRGALLVSGGTLQTASLAMESRSSWEVTDGRVTVDGLMMVRPFEDGASFHLAGGLVEIGSLSIAETGSGTGAGSILVSGGTLTLGGLALHTDNSRFDLTGGVVNSPGADLSNGLTTLAGGTFNAGDVSLGFASSSATLNIGNGGAAPVVNIDRLVGNSTPGSFLNFNHTTNGFVFATQMRGLLQLRQSGPGSTILTGDNVYGGTTTITSGTLQVGNGGATGSLGVSDVVNDAALVFNRSGTLSAANVITGSGRVRNSGPGLVILSGSNSYAGGTIVQSGTLAAAHNRALGTGGVTVEGGTLSILTGVTVANAITLGGGTLDQGYASGANLAGALQATSHFANGRPDTGASILAGTLSADATLSARFTDSSTAANDEVRFSDVLHLDGLPAAAGVTDIFVLELSLTSVAPSSYLGWLNGANEWVNAALGNTGNNASAEQQGYHGSFAQFQSEYTGPLSGYIGAWGFTNSSVWAVLNHNSEFSIVPEPSAWTLFAFTATALLIFRRRRLLP